MGGKSSPRPEDPRVTTSTSVVDIVAFALKVSGSETLCEIVWKHLRGNSKKQQLTVILKEVSTDLVKIEYFLVVGGCMSLNRLKINLISTINSQTLNELVPLWKCSHWGYTKVYYTHNILKCRNTFMACCGQPYPRGTSRKPIFVLEHRPETTNAFKLKL